VSLDALLPSPVRFLEGRLGRLQAPEVLARYEAYFEERGKGISEAVDRAGTPPLRMFDRFGNRIDEVVFPPEYRELLLRGYEAGVVFRAVEEGDLAASYQVGYVTSFYDAGLYCPHTVSLSTAIPLAKYGSAALRATYLPKLLRRDGSVWQGATWMTEAKGGSDLGSFVETVARPDGDRWLLTGEKYFTSNVGAELAIAAARPAGAPAGVRGLELFLVPQRRDDGSLNFRVRRLKDKIGTRSVPTGEVELNGSVGYLLGERGQGTYLVLEALNVSRVCNSVGSVALTQRALHEAWSFAEGRVAFGKPVAEQPLFARQARERHETLLDAFALAWEAVTLLSEVWRETPRYSDRYHLFRLVAHLSKFWTAEVAVQTAKWAMEAHGGAGILADYPVERLLREAMILGIWEGTPHRQILDGMEVVEKKRVHVPLLDGIAARGGNAVALAMARAEVDDWLAIPAERKEAESERVFARLAGTVARELRRAAG
jgi:alkylation response protein AidB-like acyl-CoA dehydrogenase